ncbi:MAG: hypothetical protein QOC99_511 [Acidobacteriota bacterium]|nr:hypothetical protein [Acidobacteriota bacterium]
MNKLRSPKASPIINVRPRTRMLACCLFALLFACDFGAGRARAQVRPAADIQRQQSQSQPQTARQKNSASDDVDDERDESESESAGVSRDVFVRPRSTDPATVMRRAHFIYVHSDSVFLSGSEVEDSLRKRKEFQAWGMVITRNEAEADLVIEITRKSLTRRFTFSVLDPQTMEVVTSGKTRSVLFGKKIANKVAEKFANRVKVVRPYPPVSTSNP